MTDEAILAELGVRIARQRIDRRLTQAELAIQAGVSKRTVERVEAGASAQVSSLIRLLRILDLLHALDQLIPEATTRPMDLLRLKGKPRLRATPQRTGAQEKWSWEDET